MEESKEKIEEKNQNDSTNKNIDNKHVSKCCASNKSLVVLLVVLGVLIIGGGTLAASKIAFGGFRNSNKSKNGVGLIGNSRYGGMGRGMMRGSSYRGARGSGLSGSITAINGNNITVKDSNNKEYTVVVQDSTSINNSGGIAKLSDLQVGNNVSVRGPSNSSGQVTANTIIIR
jgi:hypothetical protein